MDQHREDVYRFLLAAAGPQDADDCFQETFMAALRAYPRLESGSNLRAWVLTIAQRKAIDAHRSRRRRPAPVEQVPERPGHGGLPGSHRDGDIWAAGRELPTKQRLAVAHRFVNDLAFADIGRVMGCSEEAARRSVHEGMKRLREVWA